MRNSPLLQRRHLSLLGLNLYYRFQEEDDGSSYYGSPPSRTGPGDMVTPGQVCENRGGFQSLTDVILRVLPPGVYVFRKSLFR
jgi:hypothetical protein